jgi:flagellar hook-associated protein 1 FlgK
MTDLLAIGASGIRAYGSALAAVGNNVSNASTAGYVRRTVTLANNQAAGSSDLYNTLSPQFGGVVTTNVTRAWNDYQALAVRNANAEAGATDAKSTWYAATEAALNDGATGVGESATAFFNAGDALAADTGSSANRQQFLASLDQTADAFNSTATALAQTATGIGQQAQTAVQDVNTKLDALDKVNAALNRAVDGSSGQADLQDQRDQLLDGISSQIGITVSLDPKGVATVTLPGTGTQLTAGLNGNAGNTGTRLALQQSANGQLTVQALSSGSATTQLHDVSGAIGGLVDSSAQVAGRRDSLDTMAKNFMSQVNAWQAGGKTGSGTTPDPAVTALLSGTSAATIKLTTSDPSVIAVQSTNGTSNGNLLALANLRTSGGVEQSWTTMLTDQGQVTAAAKTADTAAASTQSAAMSARDTTSGVDLDTEAADLIRYQQAYSGAAKVIQVAKDTMDSILALF